jgi:hypothetical protein
MATTSSEEMAELQDILPLPGTTPAFTANPLSPNKLFALPLRVDGRLKVRPMRLIKLG